MLNSPGPLIAGFANLETGRISSNAPLMVSEFPTFQMRTEIQRSGLPRVISVSAAGPVFAGRSA